MFLLSSLWLPDHSYGQVPSATGSLKIIGLTRITGKKVTLKRSRFYLIRGGIKDNEGLIERIRTTETTSRDCFYSNIKASPQFMCWLKNDEYNCESAYCRKITTEDIEKVPEFITAYRRGIEQFDGRSDIARDWLTTNLPFDLREGFYRQQKAALDKLIDSAKPIQTIMTDTSKGTAYFVDIPLNLESGGKKKKSETFLISNLLPAEILDKSYVWACEVKIGTKKQATLVLQSSEKSKKKCVVITKALPVCKTTGCEDNK